MTALEAYKALQSTVEYLEAHGSDEIADRVRDVMDALWYRLSDDDRRKLDREDIDA